MGTALGTKSLWSMLDAPHGWGKGKKRGRGSQGGEGQDIPRFFLTHRLRNNCPRAGSLDPGSYLAGIQRSRRANKVRMPSASA